MGVHQLRIRLRAELRLYPGGNVPVDFRQPRGVQNSRAGSVPRVQREGKQEPDRRRALQCGELPRRRGEGRSALQHDLLHQQFDRRLRERRGRRGRTRGRDHGRDENRSHGREELREGTRAGGLERIHREGHPHGRG